MTQNSQYQTLYNKFVTSGLPTKYSLEEMKETFLSAYKEKEIPLPEFFKLDPNIEDRKKI
ncbi:hypothetical protein [Aeribacillus alveayuensis]|uniref:Uncharacterized protein n=1 Tax=Aeribacillus alveayuensis TaxID=279215 RepID=A0ABT9VST0_9BACI|nr:hypothetical protein [Bacillus alveayuensis]